MSRHFPPDPGVMRITKKEKTIMKKTTAFLALTLALLTLPLLALAESISVYNWGDYIEPEVLELKY